MRFSTATVISSLAAFAAAYTQPDYSKDPAGNAITYPGLQQQVPEGKPFEITWTPTVGDYISLVLLEGPSTDVKPIQTIVENIKNSGSYWWTPSTSLTPQSTHYGLLLVVEGTGAYQYSTQFGLTAAAGSSSVSSSASTAAATIVTVIDDKTTTICPETETQTTAAPTTTPESIVTVIDNETTTICPETETQATGTASAAQVTSWSTSIPSTELTTTICPETETGAATTAPSVPTGSLTRRPIKPSTSGSASTVAVAATGTASPSASSTPAYNGAGQKTVSFGAVVAALFAVMAF
ncbi:differential expressed balu-42 [Penicillium verhagenii]|nr:differential expressed balu-42 [Penicillium verhagenii]